MLYDEDQYNQYKTNNIITKYWNYNTNMSFKAVYMPKPVTLTIDAGENNGFNRGSNTYVRTIVSTISSGWRLGKAFLSYGLSEIPTAVSPGYTFNYWYVENADGSITRVNNDTSWTFPDRTVIKANYTAHKYNIVYTRGAAPTGENVKVSSISYGQDVTAIANPFEYFCYRFTGWKIKDSDITYELNGDVTSKVKQWDSTYVATSAFIVADIVKDLTSKNNVDVIVEAQWEEAAAFVIFDKGTPSSVESDKINKVTGTMERQPVPAQGTATLSAIGYSVEGYKCIGWSDMPVDVTTIMDGTEDVYVLYGNNEQDASKPIVARFDVNEGDEIVLYPIWQKITYSIKLNYPKYTKNIAEEYYTARFDGYVDPQKYNGFDYENAAFDVITWSFKNPGDKTYDTIEEAKADLGAQYVVDPANPMVYRKEYGLNLYAVSTVIGTKIQYKVMNNISKVTNDLDLSLNSALIQMLYVSYS